MKNVNQEIGRNGTEQTLLMTLPVVISFENNSNQEQQQQLQIHFSFYPLHVDLDAFWNRPMKLTGAIPGWYLLPK